MEGNPIVSLCLNVPGFPKSNGTVHQFFGYCLSDLIYYLRSHTFDLQSDKAIEEVDSAGNYFVVPFIPGRYDLNGCKEIFEDFEINHPLGRFVDVDLFDSEGNAVSSGRSKSCFFCQEKPAIECRRLETHNLEELRSFMFERMATYCEQRRQKAISAKLAYLAIKSILDEISLTPKPGLVDKQSRGSHKDMNFRSFTNSTAAISPLFEEMVSAGFSFKDKDFTKALPIIRNIGLRMESAMFQATGNINTQKGIIFLIGISLFSCGVLYRQRDHFDTKQFRKIIKEICKDLVKRELIDRDHMAISHGEEIFKRFGFTGARGEVESGFKTVFDIGLPRLSGVKSKNQETLIKSFLAIACQNMDTNILYRGGPKVLGEFQVLCKKALDKFNEFSYSRVIGYCRRKNISPGGSADLLTVVFFIHSLTVLEGNGFFSQLERTNDI
jgi:holo-ACP synthase/triphosphoribosyl-dephospho-CoA synthase